MLRLGVGWAILHQVELLQNWHLLRARKPPARIAPLE